eukprot:529135_1
MGGDCSNPIDHCTLDNYHKLFEKAGKAGQLLKKNTEIRFISETGGSISSDDSTNVTHCEWSISADEIAKYKTLSNQKYICSDFFMSGPDLKWYLSLYPNGAGADSYMWLSLYLNVFACPEGVQSVEIKYMIQCKEINEKRVATTIITKQRFSEFFGSHKDGHGYPKFCLSRKILNQKTWHFIVDVQVMQYYDEYDEVIPNAELWSQDEKEKDKNNFKAVDSTIDPAYDKSSKITTCKWTIPQGEMEKFANLPNGSCTESDYFRSENNIIWYLSCYPNGENKEDQDYMSLVLNVHSNSNSIRKLRIKCLIKCEQLNQARVSSGIIVKNRRFHRYCFSNELFAKTSKKLEFTVTIDTLEYLDKNAKILANEKCLTNYEISNGVIKNDFNIVDSSIQASFDKPRKTQRCYWTIQGIDIKRLRNGSCTESDYFKTDNNLIFYLVLYPFGRNNDDNGYVSVFLKIYSYPHGVNGIYAKCMLRCPQVNKIKTFKKESSEPMGVEKFFISDELLSHSNPSIDFLIDIEILQRYDQMGRMLPNPDQYNWFEEYKESATNYFQPIDSKIDCSFDANQNIQTCMWTISPTDVENFKNLPIGTCIESDYFISDKNLGWFLTCYPNGKDESYKDNVSLFLTAYSYPSSVGSIKIGCKIELTQINQKQMFNVGCMSSNQQYGYGKFCLSSELIDCTQLEFNVHIKLLKYYNDCGKPIRSPRRRFSEPQLNKRSTLKLTTMKNSFNQTIKSTIKTTYDKRRKIQYCKWSIGENEVQAFTDLPTRENTQSDYFVSDKDLNWFLEAYPRGNTEKEADKLSLFLGLQSLPSGVEQIEIKCIMKLIQINTTKIFTTKLSQKGRKGSYGFPKFCATKKLRPCSSLDFDVHIEILKYYDCDGEEIKQQSVDWTEEPEAIEQNYLKAIQSTIHSSFDANAKIQVAKWTISADDIREFRGLPNGKSTESDYFLSDKNVLWHLECFPNGVTVEDQEFCELRLCLLSLPRGYKSIKVYFYLSCKETGSMVENCAIYCQEYEKWGWPIRTELASAVRAQDSISFECGVRILQIIDTSGNSIFTNSFVLSQISKKQTLMWHVNDINKWQYALWGKRVDACLVSKNDKQMFSLKTYPNGEEESYQGNLSIYLQAFMFPFGVKKMKIKCTLKCIDLKIEKTFKPQQFVSISDELQLSEIQSIKSQSAWGFNKFFEYKKLIHSTLDFVAEVEILECYDKDDMMIKDIKFKETITNFYINKATDEFSDDETVDISPKHVKRNALIISLVIKQYDNNNKFKDITGIEGDIDNYKQVLVNEYKYKLISNIDDAYREKYGYRMTRKKVNSFFRDCRAKLFDYKTDELYYDSLFVTVGAHGASSAVVCSDGKLFKYKDIRSLFQNDTKLNSIPSIYLIDACRSEDIFEIEEKNNDAIVRESITAKTNSTTLFGTSSGNTVKGAKVSTYFSKRMHMNFQKNKEKFMNKPRKWNRFYKTYRAMQTDIEKETQFDHAQALNIEAHDPAVDDIRFMPNTSPNIGTEISRGSDEDHDYFGMTWNVTIIQNQSQNRYTDTKITLDYAGLQVIFKYDNDQEKIVMKRNTFHVKRENKIVYVTQNKTEIEIECAENCEAKFWGKKLTRFCIR